MTFILDGIQQYIIPIAVGAFLVLAVVDLITGLADGTYTNGGGGDSKGSGGRGAANSSSGGDGFFDKFKWKELGSDLAAKGIIVVVIASIVYILTWMVGGISQSTGVNVGI